MPQRPKTRATATTISASDSAETATTVSAAMALKMRPFRQRPISSRLLDRRQRKKRVIGKQHPVQVLDADQEGDDR